MADRLLQEIDEALRADRAASLWNQHKKTIIVLVAALILGTAANSIWKSYREAQGGKALLALTESQKLLTSGNADEAAKGFEQVAASSSGELRTLAKIWQARALVAAKQNDEAITVLKSASEEGTSLWADIACLRLAGLAPKEAACLSATHASPLASERAQWAAATAWSNGERDTAIQSLEKIIADESTSQESRTQMTQWLAIMKADTKETNE